MMELKQNCLVSLKKKKMSTYTVRIKKEHATLIASN